MKHDVLLMGALCFWCLGGQYLPSPGPVATVAVPVVLTAALLASLCHSRARTALALGVGYSAVFGRQRVQQHLCAFLVLKWLRWVGRPWQLLRGFVVASPGFRSLLFEGGGLVAGLVLAWVITLAAASVIRRPLHRLSSRDLVGLVGLLGGLATGSWLLATLFRDALTSLVFHLCSGTTPVFALLALLSLPRQSVPTAALVSLALGLVLMWWWWDPKSLGQLLLESVSFVRIVMGLFMNVVLFALLRTQHPMRYRVLLLNLSTCAGMVVSGVLPSVVELSCCLRAVSRVVHCLLSAPGTCWSYERDLHAVLVAAVLPCLVASFATWRANAAFSRHAAAAKAPPPLFDLDFDTASFDSPRRLRDRHREIPEATKRRVQDLREALPLQVKQWAEQSSSLVTAQVLGGVAGWVLWELLSARCAKDVAAILHALSPPSAATWHIRRTHILEDGIACLGRQAAVRLRTSKPPIAFADELGQDVGGVSRDFFTQFAAAAAATLFVADDDGRLVPLPSREEGDALDAPCAAVGRFLGLCCLQGHLVDLPLRPAVYKMMVGQPVTVEDVRLVDPVFFQNRFEPLLHDGGVEHLEAVTCEPLHFTSAATPLAPDPRPLRAGGGRERVTDANRREYLQLLAEHYLIGGGRRQLLALIDGFHEVVPVALLRGLGVGPRELEYLLTGAPGIDVADWRTHTEVEGATTAARVQVVRWFWAAVGAMGPRDRARLLTFITGRARVPVEGFRRLRCLITFDDNPDHLPAAHTCTNALVLPVCRSAEDLTRGLQLVLGDDMAMAFGLA